MKLDEYLDKVEAMEEQLVKDTEKLMDETKAALKHLMQIEDEAAAAQAVELLKEKVGLKLQALYAAHEVAKDKALAESYT